jgi:glycosyltransferase involved in cell wall biosynthesis
MNILYLSYDGLTDPLGQSQILPYLAELTKKGYQFTILSFEKRERFKKEGATIQSITQTNGIRWVPLFFTPKPPVLAKIYDRYQMQRTAITLHKQHRFAMIHCRSYVAAEMGLLLKQRFGVKMLFDMRGFWADEKVDNGQWKLKSPLYKRIYDFYKKREREFLLKADGIVSLTEAAKTYLLQQKGYEHLRIDVIPCCADLQHFDYNKMTLETTAKQKAALDIPAEAKVVTYLGSIGGWYMTKEMFRFFATLIKKDPAYVMLLLTKDDPARVEGEAQEAGIPKEKLFITYATRDKLPAYLSFCNSSIFFIRNTFSKMASSPTKHAELMGMGIPVVCNAIGDTGNIITATSTGLLLNDFNPSAMEEAVAKISELEKMDKAHIRQAAKNLFDLKAGSEKYAGLYNRIIKNN